MFAMFAGVPGKLKTLLDRLTSARATNLDNLNATVSSRAAASTALSNATWTDARAGYIDALSGVTAGLPGRIKSIQTGWVRTTTALSTTGVSTDEEFRYYDVSISSVNAAKCVALFQPAQDAVTDRYTVFVKTSTTLRICGNLSSVTDVRGRWYVVEIY